jgi:hypothetical protein
MQERGITAFFDNIRLGGGIIDNNIDLAPINFIVAEPQTFFEIIKEERIVGRHNQLLTCSFCKVEHFIKGFYPMPRVNTVDWVVKDNEIVRGVRVFGN